MDALKLLTDPSDNEIVFTYFKQYVLETKPLNHMKFIEHWLQDKTLPIWCNEYKLLDPQLFEEIRFNLFLDDVNLDRTVAIKRVTDIYGLEYIRDVINVDLNTLYNKYISKSLYHDITFDDQFAIANFITSRYSRIHLYDFEALHMKSALYRTALRQYDDPFY